MRDIGSMLEAEEVLAGFVPLTKKITGLDITLERMRPLMEVLGNPQDRLKIIHVAGTSGKTSTAYYIATMLQLSGSSVGLTVSPHVDSVTERMQVNGQPISDLEFIKTLNEYLDIIDQSEIQPTYFELIVSMAYWYFDRIGVDYVVAETGMGGLHDGTNIANRHDKVCVITDIGIDHTRFLGDTVDLIAKQKAGIIHEKNVVFMNLQPDEVMQVFEDRCREVGAELNIAAEDGSTSPSNIPDFQKRNWLLAHAVFKHTASRDRLPELSDDDQEKSMQVVVPGRMDSVVLAETGKKIIMDGAHNEQKMQAFVNSFRTKYPDQKAVVLLALKQGKELMTVLPLIKPITSKLIITEFEAGQDLPIPAIDAQELSVAAEKFGFDDIVTEPDKEKAYEIFVSEPGDIGVITGSFYLIGQLRSTHEGLING